MKKNDDCKGEVAHERVLEQFNMLTCPDGLLVQTMRYIKESNTLAQRNNARLTVLSKLLAVGAAMIVVLTTVIAIMFNDVVTFEKHVTTTLAKLDLIAISASANSTKLDDVQTSTDAIRQSQDAQTKVELVPEKDPTKAKDAPLRVRIVPGMSSGAPVEIPLPAPSK